MNITEFRTSHQKDMLPETEAAGIYLEHQGLLFGYDFVTGDAVTLAAAFLTRKHDEQEKETKVEKLVEARSNRFEDEDWEDRYA